MKVQLLRAARINHNAGDIVEVSTESAMFLMSTGSAKPLGDVKEAVEELKAEPKKTTRRSTKK